jgi:hypothetical protein
LTTWSALASIWRLGGMRRDPYVVFLDAITDMGRSLSADLRRVVDEIQEVRDTLLPLR